MLRSLLRSALATVVGALPLVAQTSPSPSFEQTLSLRSASSPVISPDGRNIVYSVRSTEWSANRYDSELWLARENEPPFQLTRTEKENSNTARWAPDSKSIAFLADRGSKRQIYVVRVAGGEAQPLTDYKDGISDFEWSPDGTRIAFTAMDSVPKDQKDRVEKFGEYAVEDAEYRLTHLWVFDVKSDSIVKPTRLTQGSFTITGFDWSPDGKSIVFSQQRDPLINSGNTSDIYVLEVATKQVRPLVTGPGADNPIAWSPDSKWIIYESAAGDTVTNYYANSQLYRISRDGGAPMRIATDIDENIGGITWSKAGAIYGIVTQGAASRRLVSIDPETGKARIITGGPDLIGQVSVADDGRTVALTGATSTTLAEIYRGSVGAGGVTVAAPLSSMSQQIRDWPIGTVETVSWTSKDGAKIEGVLHKPADFDPKKKYPLFVVIHGGPTGIDTRAPTAGYVYPIMQWVARGALVLRPNYRGSAGYGAKFRALNVRNLGVGDAWDVLSGVDYLARLGFVDTTRMGAMGWSQGGYISAFLTTTTTRFKAISVGAGISDWMTYYVNTDIHPFTRQYLKATPWDDPAIYAKTSPMTYINQAKTPTLIQHGELDPRVPIPNARELFQGLQDRGVPVKLVVYKGFGHGITKPKEQLAAYWHNWEWFGKYVWGETVVMAGSAP